MSHFLLSAVRWCFFYEFLPLDEQISVEYETYVIREDTRHLYPLAVSGDVDHYVVFSSHNDMRISSNAHVG